MGPDASTLLSPWRCGSQPRRVGRNDPELRRGAAIRQGDVADPARRLSVHAVCPQRPEAQCRLHRRLQEVAH